jgi:hypothetical protein
MKPIWRLASAITALGFLMSPTSAQDFRPGITLPFVPKTPRAPDLPPGVTLPFVPHTQAPRPDIGPFVPPACARPSFAVGERQEKKDQQQYRPHLLLPHLLPHGAPTGALNSGSAETAPRQPSAAGVATEGFSPHANVRVPEVSPSRLSVPRGSWFSSGSRGGILAGNIGGAVHAPRVEGQPAGLRGLSRQAGRVQQALRASAHPRAAAQ